MWGGICRGFSIPLLSTASPPASRVTFHSEKRESILNGFTANKLPKTRRKQKLNDVGSAAIDNVTRIVDEFRCR